VNKTEEAIAAVERASELFSEEDYVSFLRYLVSQTRADAHYLRIAAKQILTTKTNGGNK
jgi:hypothetical protein